MTEIRTGRPSDVDEVTALWRAHGGPTRSTGDPDEARRLIERDPEALIVAEVDGRIVGTLIIGWDGWRCHMYRLAALPDHRRTGVARRLVAEAVTRARGLGVHRIDATVQFENDGARRFWEACGFKHLPDDHGRWSLPVS